MQKLAIVLLTLFLVHLQVRLWLGEGSVTELMSLQGQLERLKLENGRLYQRNRLLVKEVLELQQGMDTVEEHARLDLGMIRPDETFFLTYD